MGALAGLLLTGCGANPYGDPYGYGANGYGYGDSYGSAYGDSYGGSEYGSSYGSDYGSSTGSAYGSDYGSSYGSDYGSSYGSDYGSSLGGGYDSGYGSDYGSSFGGGASPSPRPSGRPADPVLPPTDELPALSAWVVEVKETGVLGMGKVIAKVSVENPSARTLSGRLEVRFTDDGNPTANKITERVTLAPREKRVMTFTAKGWRLDDAEAIVTTDVEKGTDDGEGGQSEIRDGE